MKADLKIIEHTLLNIERLLLSQKTVLTFAEVVQYTGISESYLYKLTSQRRIPHSKPNGKLIYFEKSAIDAWLLNNRIKQQSEIESKAANYVLPKFKKQ